MSGAFFMRYKKFFKSILKSVTKSNKSEIQRLNNLSTDGQGFYYLILYITY